MQTQRNAGRGNRGHSLTEFKAARLKLLPSKASNEQLELELDNVDREAMEDLFLSLLKTITEGSYETPSSDNPQLQALLTPKEGVYDNKFFHFEGQILNGVPFGEGLAQMVGWSAHKLTIRANMAFGKGTKNWTGGKILIGEFERELSHGLFTGKSPSGEITVGAFYQNTAAGVHFTNGPNNELSICLHFPFNAATYKLDINSERTALMLRVVADAGIGRSEIRFFKNLRLHME